MMDRIADIPYRMLTELAVYRYLTSDQMLRLGVSADRSKSRVYRHVKELASGKKPLMGSYAPRPLPNEGKLPYLHFLTPHGAKLAADMLELTVGEIKHPRRAPMFRNQYWHVKWCVDDEISVRLWAREQGHVVDWYHSYLDTTGANRGGGADARRSTTKVDMADGSFIIPDAVCRITDPEGIDRLCVFEVHNQMRSKRIEERLKHMRHAIAQEAIERQFGYDASPRVCVVFEHDAALNAAARRMAGSGDFRGYEPLIFLTTHEAMARDFRHGWRRIDDTRGCALF